MKMKEEGFCDGRRPRRRRRGRHDAAAAGTGTSTSSLTHNRFTLLNRQRRSYDRLRHLTRYGRAQCRTLWRRRLRQGLGRPPENTPIAMHPPTFSMPSARWRPSAQKYGVPPGAAAALQFSMRDPRVTATVCGVSKPEPGCRNDQMGPTGRFPECDLAGPRGNPLLDRKTAGGHGANPAPQYL
jgi:D-threo-aldose 1-dehydrogenase